MWPMWLMTAVSSPMRRRDCSLRSPDTALGSTGAREVCLASPFLLPSVVQQFPRLKLYPQKPFYFHLRQPRIPADDGDGDVDRIRLRTAHVLLVNLSAVANEIAKNLVLAGIGAITLLDRAAVSDQDLGAQFLIAEEDVGRNVSCQRPALAASSSESTSSEIFPYN